MPKILYNEYYSILKTVYSQSKTKLIGRKGREVNIMSKKLKKATKTKILSALTIMLIIFCGVSVCVLKYSQNLLTKALED